MGTNVWNKQSRKMLISHALEICVNLNPDVEPKLFKILTKIFKFRAAHFNSQKKRKKMSVVRGKIQLCVIFWTGVNNNWVCFLICSFHDYNYLNIFDLVIAFIFLLWIKMKRNLLSCILLLRCNWNCTLINFWIF